MTATMTCQSCDGDKRHTCRTCRGNGSPGYDIYVCWACDGSGWEACERCGGSGTVEVECEVVDESEARS